MILLEGWEADMVRDKTIFFDGYWLTGLDVIHQMHCLVRSQAPVSNISFRILTLHSPAQNKVRKAPISGVLQARTVGSN